MAYGNDVGGVIYLFVVELIVGLIRVGDNFHTAVRGNQKRRMSQPLYLYFGPPLRLYFADFSVKDRTRFINVRTGTPVAPFVW
jgi:hypothetical protein